MHRCIRIQLKSTTTWPVRTSDSKRRTFASGIPRMLHFMDDIPLYLRKSHFLKYVIVSHAYFFGSHNDYLESLCGFVDFNLTLLMVCRWQAFEYGEDTWNYIMTEKAPSTFAAQFRLIQHPFCRILYISFLM